MKKLYEQTNFFLSVKIDCILDKYLCNVKLKMYDYGIT